jgi:endonuclease-8
MVAATAVGKQLFLEFVPTLGQPAASQQSGTGEGAPADRVLRVHLGLYGAWDFAGEIDRDATLASANGRMGQTNQRGTFLEQISGDDAFRPDPLPESSLGSIGAPRRTRLRMAEQENGEDVELTSFPPEPIGQVRLRLLTERAVADLRGPTACEVLNPEQVERAIAKLGPDPMHDSGKKAEDRFVAAVRKTVTPIGLLLMDQSVVAGIGNVYRAELLFRARLNPHTPGKEVPVPALRKLWKDWTHLLEIGVRTGQMMTRDDLDTDEKYARAMASREDRHYVYKRTGLKSPRGRGTVVMEDMGGRNLYWAPGWQTYPKPPKDASS